MLIDTKITKEAQLPHPVFADDRDAFAVCRYNKQHKRGPMVQMIPVSRIDMFPFPFLAQGDWV